MQIIVGLQTMRRNAQLQIEERENWKETSLMKYQMTSVDVIVAGPKRRVMQMQTMHDDDAEQKLPRIETRHVQVAATPAGLNLHTRSVRLLATSRASIAKITQPPRDLACAHVGERKSDGPGAGIGQLIAAVRIIVDNGGRSSGYRAATPDTRRA